MLHYDPVSGVFTALKSERNRVAGQVVGTITHEGYLTTNINSKTYTLHRLAFLYMEGEFPALLVDHINGNPSDNRWENLRQVTCQQNLLNAKISKRNKSGHKGVWFDKTLNVWKAQVMTNGKVWRKLFDDLDSAVAAVKDYRAKVHGEFCNHG